MDEHTVLIEREKPEEQLPVARFQLDLGCGRHHKRGLSVPEKLFLPIRRHNKIVSTIFGREPFGNNPLKEKIANFCFVKKLAIFMVPRAGIEPARIASLVFETSASTDSATWACK